MVHAALLLLMLEAKNTDLVFTISLKRSTQNFQLSTSLPGPQPAARSRVFYPDGSVWFEPVSKKPKRRSQAKGDDYEDHDDVDVASAIIGSVRHTCLC
jgi:hypothetical protein